MLSRSYAEHLSQVDRVALAEAAKQVGAVVEKPDPSVTPVMALLERPDVAQAILRDPSFEASGSVVLPSATVSPFLVFAAGVHRAAHDLSGALHVTEWLGPRLRVPLLGTGEVGDVLASPRLRLFLAELLASFTHVASGSVMVRTRRGLRRQRFSELDPVRLASLLEVVPPSEKAGVYRRLGDVALFLCGVFPDHTAANGLGPYGETRLLRSLGDRGRRSAASVERPNAGPGPSPFGGLPDQGAVRLLEELGPRWYSLACRSAPAPLTGSMKTVELLVERFGAARRALNFVTDRYLFPHRDLWWGSGL